VTATPPPQAIDNLLRYTFAMTDTEHEASAAPNSKQPSHNSSQPSTEDITAVQERKGIISARRLFTPIEKRNLASYIQGIIMLYKFSYETFNGSITALATNRFDYQSAQNNSPNQTFFKVVLMDGLSQLMQVVGAVVFAPMGARVRSKWLMVGSAVGFGVLGK
jgi:hypothetical protein